MKEDLKNLRREALEVLLSFTGDAPWRVDEILRWIYRRGARSFEEMTSLPKTLRDALEGEYRLFLPDIVDSARAGDGTEKLLLLLEDGVYVETVVMPEGRRFTQCLSSQSGCALACAFCRTGKIGFARNLAASEIADQWLMARDRIPGDTAIGNLVYMGMGEPLLNFEALRDSLEIFTSPWGGGLSPGRITVSTAGVIPGIERMVKELPPVKLAVSLNAADDELRSRLMPINRKYPIDALVETLRRLPRGRRRTTIEYVLLGGTNDSAEAARALARLLRGVRCKINLIPFNAHSGLPFSPPSEESIEQFRYILVRAGYAAPVRRSKGSDIAAACGQLGAGRRGKKGSVRKSPGTP